MMLQEKVVLAIVLVACLASSAQAVFGDGSLTARHQEKGRSLSKRSIFDMLPSFSWWKHPFSRSASDVNSTTADTTTYPTTQAHTESGLKSDIARMLTLTRRKRALHGGHSELRGRRSVQELRNIEGFLKAKHNSLTDVLRNFNGALFGGHHHHNHHQQQQQQVVQPQPGQTFFVPFGFQPGQNTVLFLHHLPNTSNNNNNNPMSGSSNVNSTGAIVSRPTLTAAPAATATGVPPVAIVGSAGPQFLTGTGGPASAPVIIVVPQSSNNNASAPMNMTTQSAPQSNQTAETTTSMTPNVEPRRSVTLGPTADGSSTSKPDTETGAQTSQAPEVSTGAPEQQESTTVGGSPKE